MTTLCLGCDNPTPVPHSRRESRMCRTAAEYVTRMLKCRASAWAAFHTQSRAHVTAAYVSASLLRLRLSAVWWQEDVRSARRCQLLRARRRTGPAAEVDGGARPDRQHPPTSRRPRDGRSVTGD